MNAGEPGSESIATDGEIERERTTWEAKRRKEHLEFVKRFTFHTSTTFMDYLHGDVREEETDLACFYEYARESKIVWEAADERDALQRASRHVDLEQVALSVIRRHPEQWWAKAFWAMKFLMCESFPKSDWNELSNAQRDKIMDGPSRRGAPPLPMIDVYMLEAMGVFEEFKAMAKRAEPVIENVPIGKQAKPMKLVAPVLPYHSSRYHVLFNLDFSQGETRLIKQFQEWLRLPENRERLSKYKKESRGNTGKPLDRLKDLAAWRLYRECNNDMGVANKFACDHRKYFENAAEIREKCKKDDIKKHNYKSGDARPFRDAKPKKEKQANRKPILIPANEADLFGEDADARKAKANAWEFMTEIMPQEFASPGRGMLEVFVELEKCTSKG
jgi:hypothetical protein